MIKQEYIVLGGTAFGSFVVGGVAGYFFSNKKAEAKYALLMKQEIDSLANYYKMREKKDEYADPSSIIKANGYSSDDDFSPSNEDAIEEAIEMIDQALEDVEEINNILEDVKEINNNIFDSQDDDGFDLEYELKHRNEELPFLITKQEYFDNDTNYNQTTLTYFEGDDVLSDEKDEVIPDSDSIVGNQNLFRFGKGSGDRNIVYVRNHNIETDFEIIRNEKAYTKEVLGYIEHSDSSKHKGKFKDYYQ